MSDSNWNGKVRPLQDRIIVRRHDGEEQTASGLYIPDSAKEKPQKGVVVAVGKGKVRDDGTVQPVGLKPGEEVLFGKYSGQEIRIDDEEFLIMREEDIYGVVETA